MSVSVVRFPWLFLGLISLSVVPACDRPPPTLFEELAPEDTGIDFVNQLTADRRLNIIDFNGFYNGGGVAAGDINNDGLIDLYFTSNRGKNRLYLNEGNLNFRDITDSARVAGAADWTTGVTMTDLNGDGLLDIYVTALSGYQRLEGRNQLFINQGNARFIELATILNLDADTYGAQTTFFDYDHDGDLDCYLVNMSNDRVRIQQRGEKREETDYRTGDRLYENRAGQFKDVSREAGIHQGPIGFGLAASVADFNGDGWEDIYVSNDFYENDYFYVNNRDGTFSERGGDFFGHTSRFSMGSDVADINNDGWPDLLTLDMAPEDEAIEKRSLGRESYATSAFKRRHGYRHQYGQNTLQLNRGGRGFAEIACLAGVEATDWSWAPLFADFDNDGNQDLFVANGIVKRPNDLDLIQYLRDYTPEGTEPADMAKYYRDYYDNMPFGVWHDYGYRGRGDGRFTDETEAWGLGKPTVSNGTTYADLDNDGDLELIINRINQPALLYRNTARERGTGHYLAIELEGGPDNRFGIGARVSVAGSFGVRTRQLMLTRGFLSSVAPRLHVGLGAAAAVDSVWVDWPGGGRSVRRWVAGDQVITLRYENRRPVPDTPRAAASPVIAPAAAQENDDLRHDPSAYFDQYPLAPFSEPISICENFSDDLGAHAGARTWGTVTFGGKDLPGSRGLWRSVVVADFDGDGDADIIGGNMGLNTRLIKSDGVEKVRLYRKDLDGNGSVEEILAYNLEGTYFPTNNRDELGKVVPGIVRKRFSTNAAFAGAGVETVLGEALDGAEMLETDLLASTYFENDGHGNFTARPLPLIAQYAPVFALAVADVNGDGFPDVVGAGNQYGVSPYQGRYDAGRGFLLYGGPAGPVEGRELDVPGEVREITVGEGGTARFVRLNAPPVEVRLHR